MKKLLPNLWNNDGIYVSHIPLRYCHLPNKIAYIFLQRTAVPSDEWRRFDEYALRVEVLGVDELDTRERYVWQLYCQVCSLRPGVIPFPNLRKLRLYQDYEQADHAASLLLFPPSLRSFRIDFGSATFNRSLRVAEGYLQAAAQQVPTLEHLSMHGDPPQTSYMCIVQHKHLRVLDLRHSHTVDAQVYRDLISTASTMNELVEFHLPDQGMNGISGCIPCCKGFRLLRVLGIHASPSNIFQLLDTLDTPCLRAVVCKGGNIQSTPFEWRMCVERLCIQHGLSLRSVELRSRGINVWDSNTGTRRQMFKDITTSLLQLHLLEDVALEFFMVDLSTEDLYAMASAWPCLRHLKIRSRISHHNRAPGDPPTYNCLIFLARLCPKLIHLELFFQDDELPDISEWPLLSHGLRELKLDVPRRIRDQLVPFLDRLFPHKYDQWIR
jgi:hypothetical protein